MFCALFLKALTVMRRCGMLPSWATLIKQDTASVCPTTSLRHFGRCFSAHGRSSARLSLISSTFCSDMCVFVLMCAWPPAPRTVSSSYGERGYAPSVRSPTSVPRYRLLFSSTSSGCLSSRVGHSHDGRAKVPHAHGQGARLPPL